MIEKETINTGDDGQKGLPFIVVSRVCCLVDIHISPYYYIPTYT